MIAIVLAFAIVFLVVPWLIDAPRVWHPGPWVGFVFAIITLLTQPSLTTQELVTDASDRRSALGIFAAAFASQLAAILQFSLREKLFPPAQSRWVILGATVGALGLGLRIWAIRTLGRFFTSTVQVQQGQRVLSNGPYRLVRHPSYTGTLCTLLGSAVALGSGVGIALVAVVNIPAYLYRIRVEETALRAGLGEDYMRYQSRTWRLVPFVF